MLTDRLSKLSILANPLENNCFNRGFITHQLKSTIFDRFQLTVNIFVHVLEINAFRSIIICRT